MTTNPPSEAQASSPSPYLNDAMLRAQANPDCAFPDAVQVLSREILRLREQCDAIVARLRVALERPVPLGFDRSVNVVDVDGERFDSNKVIRAVREIVEGAEKLAPATNESRTEVPLAADGSVVLMSLGGRFHEAMREARPGNMPADAFRSEEPCEARHRHLHAAVHELASVVASLWRPPLTP